MKRDESVDACDRNRTLPCVKIGYGNEAYALAAARNFDGPNLPRAYQCPDCLRWHLTSHDAAGPMREDFLLALPGSGKHLAVDVFVRRFPNGRASGLCLRPRGVHAFVTLSRRHLPALKAALEELLRNE